MDDEVDVEFEVDAEPVVDDDDVHTGRPWRLGRGLYIGGNAAQSFVGQVSGEEGRLRRLRRTVEIPAHAREAVKWVTEGLSESRGPEKRTPLP
jgi:hypothetical protein